MPFLKGFVPGALSVIITSGSNNFLFFCSFSFNRAICFGRFFQCFLQLNVNQYSKKNEKDFEKSVEKYLKDNKETFLIGFLIMLAYLNYFLLISSIFASFLK
jgi:hypothetical protein